MRAVFFAPALLAAGVTACGPGTPPDVADAAHAGPDATADRKSVV